MDNQNEFHKNVLFPSTRSIIKCSQSVIMISLVIDNKTGLLKYFSNLTPKNDVKGHHKIRIGIVVYAC